MNIVTLLMLFCGLQGVHNGPGLVMRDMPREQSNAKLSTNDA